MTSEGSGPYTLTSFSLTTEVVLTANPHYWGPKPRYSKIIIRNVQASVQKLDVLKGESQIAVDLSPAQAQGMAGVQIVNGASPNVFFLFTNENKKISKVTSNPQFQQAIRYGINYPSLVQLAGKGALEAAGIIPSMFLGSLPLADAVQYNLAKAKAALAKSGLGHPTVTLVYPTVTWRPACSKIWRRWGSTCSCKASRSRWRSTATALARSRWASGTGDRTSRTRATT